VVEKIDQGSLALPIILHADLRLFAKINKVNYSVAFYLELKGNEVIAFFLLGWSGSFQSSDVLVIFFLSFLFH
jgi:hypothetical protein